MKDKLLTLSIALTIISLVGLVFLWNRVNFLLESQYHSNQLLIELGQEALKIDGNNKTQESI